ncbi:hypothetical protein TrCOL_g2893 [Triparma columacea]|uniref:Uncharacterized protein n=1 Tax=Triparma columacea TaxID=722753 RepID=A0A9W7GFK5_9STRA|nr:hypothetical protein TrCOL_g2893 [Triparma columacea]
MLSFLVIMLVVISPVMADSPGCPCIDGPTWDDNSLCPQEADGSPGLLIDSFIEYRCYPSDYGMKTCAVHDNTTDPACTSVADGEDRPAYCDEPWCYVDSSKCKDSIHQAYRTDLMLTKGGTPPTYSYSACGGDASQWRDPLVRDGLKGKTLKAGIADCFYPDHYMVDPVTNEPLDDGPLLDDPSKYVMKGLWIEYFEKIALYGQFEVEYYPVTTASSTKFSSLWTACANDVASGYLDLCIGNYWITESRLAIPNINFLAPTAQEQFKLLHPPYDLEDSDVHIIFTWMKPFSKTLWWCILGSVLVTGLMYHVLCAEEKFVYDPTIETAKQYKEKYEKRWAINNFFSKITKKSFFAAMEFCNAGVTFEDHPAVISKNSVKIVKLAFSFMTIIVVSCYVGNMAVLQHKPQYDRPSDPVRHCEGKVPCQICVHEVVAPFMRSNYPDMRTKTSLTGGEVLSDYANNNCSVAMSDGLDFVTHLNDTQGYKRDICQSQYDYLVYTVPISQPARIEVMDSLNYHMRGLIEDRVYEIMKPPWFPGLEDSCGKNGTNEKEDRQGDEFTEKDLSGVFFIVYGAYFLSLIVDYCDSASRDRLKVFLEKELGEAHVEGMRIEEMKAGATLSGVRERVPTLSGVRERAKKKREAAKQSGGDSDLSFEQQAQVAGLY